jgi:alpha-D-ribose 1-methylphosphonate 5-triphosphate synthase subunit PhnG
VLEPIRARLKAERERIAQQVAATKVEFFTLVRGEG